MNILYIFASIFLKNYLLISKFSYNIYIKLFISKYNNTNIQNYKINIIKAKLW